jgi:hypothetical protein
MTAHGVGSIGFEFGNYKRAIATCHGKWIGRTALATKISFSRHWGLAMNAEDCLNVMLHEIAHALTIGHDHDYVFAAKCRELGTPASGTCYQPEASIDFLWTSACPAGHKGPSMHRAPGVIKSCTKCSRSFSIDHVFMWSRSGRRVELNDMPAKYQSSYRHSSNRARLPLDMGNGWVLQSIT